MESVRENHFVFLETSPISRPGSVAAAGLPKSKNLYRYGEWHSWGPHWNSSRKIRRYREFRCRTYGLATGCKVLLGQAPMRCLTTARASSKRGGKPPQALSTAEWWAVGMAKF